MVDDASDPTGAGPTRPKRPPPTIDATATDVSTAPPRGDAAFESAANPDPAVTEAGAADPDSGRTDDTRPPGRPMLPWPAIAALCGAATGALTVAAFWLLMPQPAPLPAPQVTASAFDALAARVAHAENRPAPAATTDPRAAARLDAQDKAVAILREELGVLRAQAQQLTAAIDALKAAPRDVTPSQVDLSPVNDRLAQIEQTAKTLSAETAQRNARPANDPALRRIVAASLLDTSVRQGEPYAALLAAARPLAADPAVLKPLEPFAVSGVPGPAALSRDFLAEAARHAPKATAGADGGIVDRLQAGAARLVRVQRTDGVGGSDRDAVVSRAMAAAARNDLTAVRRELDALAPTDRAALQPWIDKADARQAALAASRQFAADAMAALARPAQ